MGWQEIERLVNERFACDCTDTEIRYRDFSNGVRHFFRQCLACGEYAALKKADVPPYIQRNAVHVDEDLREHRSKERREYAQSLRLEAKRQETEEWFEGYNEYLRSEKWRKKCQKVLQRDNHTCQACLSRQATQVHHLTYAHVFNEPLFDLQSVCDICHEFITKMDRARRGTTELIGR